MDENLIGVLRAAPSRAFTLREILDRAKIPDKQHKEAKRILKALVRKGDVEREPGKKYRLSRADTEVEGLVSIDYRGVVYLVPDGKTKGKIQPIEILPEDAERVEPGDRARVIIVVRGRRGKHYGKIEEILAREQERHIGIFRRVGQACFVELDLPPRHAALVQKKRVVHDVIIDGDHTNGAQDGQLVEVTLDTPESRGAWTAPIGRVRMVLGHPGERETEMQKLLIEHNLDGGFPDAVEQDAAKFGETPSKKDIEGRRDVRDLPLVTIDGETAKDFDDAVCAVRHENGYKLFVAIADVSHYVRPGTALDDEAFRRGTSTYLTDRAIPMLPEALSNGLCSLKPNVDRLCMLAELTLDRSGRVTNKKFGPAVMRSKARLTYTRVAAALEGAPDEECEKLLPTLLLLARIAQKLLERRLRRGAIDLDLPEAYVVFDEKGNPVDARRRDRNDAHRLIEDLMLAANEAVAQYFVDKDLPSMFRIHESPDPEKLANFVALCDNLGITAKLSKSPKPGEIARLLDSFGDHPFGRALHSLLLRALAQARYAPESEGHYGLAAKHYLHFTSPIRRYPDLVVHRVLKRVLQGEPVPYSYARLEEIATHTSDTERQAMQAERQSMDLDRALIAQRHVCEPIEGTITGVAGFGLFAALDEPFIEGLVPVRSLPDDYYELDEFGSMLLGKNRGQSFVLGDRLVFEVRSVNIARRQVELRLAEVGGEEEGASKPTVAEKPKRGRRPPRSNRKPKTAGTKSKTKTKAKPSKPNKKRGPKRRGR
ncbi:MAG: ribonuclease R [Deltaproteobacteria bacterium]